MGKLAAAVEPLDHRDGMIVGDVSTTIADVIICAVRLANVCTGGKMDVEAAVVARLREKNKLPADWPNEAWCGPCEPGCNGAHR